jgi:hypothetical protein
MAGTSKSKDLFFFLSWFLSFWVSAGLGPANKESCGSDPGGNTEGRHQCLVANASSLHVVRTCLKERMRREKKNKDGCEVGIASDGDVVESDEQANDEWGGVLRRCKDGSHSVHPGVI